MAIIQDIAAALPPDAPMFAICNRLSGAIEQMF